MNLANVPEVSRFIIVISDKGSMILAYKLAETLGEQDQKQKTNLRGSWVLAQQIFIELLLCVNHCSEDTAENKIDQISVLVGLYYNKQGV